MVVVDDLARFCKCELILLGEAGEDLGTSRGEDCVDGPITR
jgi:hypothetical protein